MENAGQLHFDLIMRWAHIVSGIFWIGLLYFFNVVNVQVMKALEPAVRLKVVPILLPRALAWFRYAAVATVVFGMYLLFAPSFYPGGPRNWDWMIVTSVVLALVMFFNVWGIIWPNQKRVIAMTAAAAASGTAPPPEMAVLARRAFLASRTNFWISFPMLLLMIFASHT